MTMEQAPHSHCVLGKIHKKCMLRKLHLYLLLFSSKSGWFFQWSEEKKSCVIAIQFRRGKI